MSKAKVYLIPNTLGTEASIDASLPSFNTTVIESLSHFAVEHIKDARRFLVKCNLKHKIDASEFYELNKKSEQKEVEEILKQLRAGHSVGVISDAGCPGIADPGARLVDLAHENNFQVVPLVGPSSILLALIASGLNGQSFTFHGYLDRDSNKRSIQLKQLETESRKSKHTQLFMETPYRNESLFEDMVKQLDDHTKVCIAADINLPTAYIRTKKVSEWKKLQRPSLQKRPAIFLLLA
jgi:16S rRNA (cytidine1402-2'-O)-methyltransferase